MRFLLLAFFSIFLFAEVKTPEQAFSFVASKKDYFYDIEFNYDKSVYLYKEQLKIIKNNKDITDIFELNNFSKKDEYEVFFDKLNFDFPINSLSENDNIKIFYQACSLEGLCYQPMVTSFTYKNNVLNLDFENKEQRKLEQKSDNNYVNDLKNSSFFISLVTFFIYGLLLSLTPCTLPMVPIISSILVKTSHKNPVFSSIIYVLGMAISYTAAGVLAAMLGSGVQEFFQNPVVIIIFSLIFVLLALSMFGVFKIALPSSLINAINNKSSGLSGVFGIFIMGVLSALIVGPCVAAPLAGLLIYIANSNDIVLGASALFCMSVGMGIPLIAVGFGFKFIQGNWMCEINKFFGFLMLAMAIYFLSRILNDDVVNTFYAVLGVFFVVFFGLFEPAKSKLRLLIKVCLVFVFIYSLYLLDITYNKSDFVVKNQANFVIAKNELNLKDKNILYFTASWCENCKIMQKTTFKNPEVIAALSQYNLIKIDISEPSEFEKKLAKKYKVFGPPVLAIVDKNGVLKKQIVGLVDAQTLLKELI